MEVAIPDHFFAVVYDGDWTPGRGDPGDLSQGANCQRFAYAVLRHFGVDLPPLRSSELWSDERHTARIEPPYEPLDLVLFNPTSDPFGAHVAVSIGGGQAIHLSKRVGRPAIWPVSRFAGEPGYEFLIGAKRPLQRKIR